MKKVIGCAILLLLLVCGGFLFFRYGFVVSEGVKAGQVNDLTYKGYIFKTWEGKLIQAGLRSTQQMMESNEFRFSVETEEVAKKIQLMGDQSVTLHYKKYNATLPWRGEATYIVDSIVGTASQLREIQGAEYIETSSQKELPAPAEQIQQGSERDYPDSFYE